MPWLTDLNNTCARINTTATAGRFLPQVSFAGIPQVLILNLIIASVLLGGFIILKKSAWAFRFFSLRSDQFFNINVAALFYGPPKDYSKYKPEEDTEMRKEERALIKEASGGIRWVWVSIYKLRDRHFLHRCGQQAVDYLRFQRMMIVALLIATIFSCAGLMPLHLIWGRVYGNKEIDEYGMTTIANIDATSYWILVHVLTTILFSLVVFVLIRRFMQIRLKPFFLHRKYRFLSRTLMISGIPMRRLRYGDTYDEHLIRQYFATAYPECNLVRVEFTYNTKKLRSIVDRKVYADFCRDFYVERKQQGEMHRQHPEDYESVASVDMYPSKCQPCRGKCMLRWFMRRVDGEEYYAKQAIKTEGEMVKEVNQVAQHPTTVIFLTFETHKHAKIVKHDFQLENRLFGWCVKDVTSSAGPRKGHRGLYHALHVNEWDVEFAPLPRYITWDNLPTGGLRWWLRAFIINIILCWFVFFLSTPPIIVRFVTERFPWLFAAPFLAQWLPTVSILILPILLPIVIEASVEWAGYYTQLRTEYVKLRNVYLFLLLTLVILPGIGVGSAYAAVQWLEEQAVSGGPKPENTNWQCILLPSAGSFFVNVMISMALLWNAFDVVRIIELVAFEVRYRCFTRSDAERAEMNRRRSDFVYTTNYAYLLTMYSTAVIFGFLCPLTCPFGLLYMCVKHVFDKYSMFYYTTPVHEIDHSVEARLSTGLHLVAVRYVYVAHFIQHFVMTFFTFLRGSPRSLYVVSFISLIAIGVFVIYQLFFAEYVDQALVDNVNEALRVKEEANVAGEAGKRMLLYEAPVFRQSRVHMNPETPLAALQHVRLSAPTPPARSSTTTSTARTVPKKSDVAPERVFDYRDAVAGTSGKPQIVAPAVGGPAGAVATPAPPLTEPTEGVTPPSEGAAAAASPAEQQEQAAQEDDTIPVEQARTETAIPTLELQENVEAAAVAEASRPRWRKRASATGPAAVAAAAAAAAAANAESNAAKTADQAVANGSSSGVVAAARPDSLGVISEDAAGKSRSISDAAAKNGGAAATTMSRKTSAPPVPPTPASPTASAAARIVSPNRKPPTTTVSSKSDDTRSQLIQRKKKAGAISVDGGGGGDDDDADDTDVVNVAAVPNPATIDAIETNEQMLGAVRTSLRNARAAFFASPVQSPAAFDTGVEIWPPPDVFRERRGERGSSSERRPAGRGGRNVNDPTRLSERSGGGARGTRNVQQQQPENIELMVARSQSASPISTSPLVGDDNRDRHEKQQHDATKKKD